MELKDCYIGMIVIEKSYSPDKKKKKIGWIIGLTINELGETVLIVRFPIKLIFEEGKQKQIYEDVFIYSFYVDPIK